MREVILLIAALFALYAALSRKPLRALAATTLFLTTLGIYVMLFFGLPEGVVMLCLAAGFALIALFVAVEFGLISEDEEPLRWAIVPVLALAVFALVLNGWGLAQHRRVFQGFEHLFTLVSLLALTALLGFRLVAREVAKQ